MSALNSRLSVENLGDRIVPTFVPTIAANPNGLTLTLTGDAQNDDAQITDFGNNVVNVTANAGADNWTFSGITQINVLGEDGHDDVRYDLVGSMLAHRSQKLVVGLGSNLSPNPGDDRFVATLHSGVEIQSRARFEIQADGGGGNDYLAVTAIGVNVRAGGWMKTSVNGGYGDDVVSQVYAGETDGSFAMRSWGNLGRDTIREVMSFDAGSTGHIGALVYGGGDADVLSLYVYMNPNMTIDKLEIHGDDDGDPTNDALFYNSPPVTAFF